MKLTRTPMVVDTVKRVVRPYDFTEDFIYADEMHFVQPSLAAMNHAIATLVNTLPALSDSQYEDYPNRSDTDNSNAPFVAPTVDALNRYPANVEVLNGKWHFAVVEDTIVPQQGYWTLYQLVIENTENLPHIAVDKFRTQTLRDYTTKYWYDGTRYYAPVDGVFRIIAINPNHGAKNYHANPELPTDQQKPTDVRNT